MKKLIGIIITICLAVSMVGCGETKNTGNETKGAASGEGGKITKDSLELSVFYHTRNTFAFDNEWPVFKKAAELTNITLKSSVPSTTSDSAQAFNLMMASGQLPDLIFAQNMHIQKYGPDGAFLPLNDLIDQYAPNIKKQLETNDEYRRSVTSDDGNIYYITGALQVPEQSDIKAQPNLGYFIRKDWLDKLNLDIPETMDEFLNVLRAFRDKDPNGNGQKDEIPFFAATAEEFYRIAVTYVGGRTGFYVGEDDKVHFGAYDSTYREGMKFARQMYSEGLVDKEIFTRGSNARDILLGNNTGGAVRGSFDTTAAYNDKLKDKIPGFDLVPMLPPKNIEGKIVEETSISAYVTSNVGGFSISAQNKYPVETIKYLDFWFGEVGSRLAEFGIEGQQYDMVEGKPKFKEEMISGDQPTILALRAIGSQQLTPYYQTGEARLQWTGPIALQGMEMYQDANCLVSPMPPLNLNTAESEVLNSSLGSIATYFSEMTQKWILGGSDVDKDFDDYIEKMRSIGMEKVLEAQQSAYERYKNK